MAAGLDCSLTHAVFIYCDIDAGGIADQYAFFQNRVCGAALRPVSGCIEKVVASIETKFDVTLASEENINALGKILPAACRVYWVPRLTP